MSDAQSIAAATMSGDLRDYLLAQIKVWSEIPWGKQPAHEQRAIAAQIEHATREAVRNAVEQLAANGAKPVRGRLVKIAAKDVLQLQVDVIKTENGRHQLLDGIGSTVLLTVAAAEQYFGERAPVKIEPDQPELLDSIPHAAE
jgi:hypothetical protein